MPRLPVVLTMVFIFFVLASASVGNAGEGKPEIDFLVKFFQGKIKDHAQVFNTQFLSQVPPAKIEEIRVMYLQKLGELREPVGEAGSYELIFSKGKAPCKVHLDPKGLVDGLWLGNWTLFDDNPDKLSEELKKLSGSGTVSVCVIRNGAEKILEIEAEKPLAVGSSFKLFVLKAMVKAFAEGKAKPEDLLSLKKEWYSHPSGVLQEWPAGTPMTLAALANLMISVSDNTATDHLINFLTREAVEAGAPARVRPFMTTLDMFRIKYGDPARAEIFARADPVVRRATLAAISTETVEIGKVRSSPFLVDSVEWFLTTKELCQTIYELRDQTALTINPGLVAKDKWNKLCYKGGSEPGVLNYTILLQKAPASPTYCLSATINDPNQPVSEDRFDELVLRLIGLIEDGRIDGKKK